MTDPLGQSQVIPYLIGLSKAGYEITLLSCEKKEKYKEQGTYIQLLLNSNNIQWEHVFFTSSPPILAKFYDLNKLKQKASKLHRKKQFSLVHCRSYVAGDIGYYLKKKFSIKFLFDIRGFWVDERVDGGLWNLNNPIYKLAYKTYKKKEAKYIAAADTIVSLTENGKLEMQKWPSYNSSPIDVIPCCADYDLFTLQTEEDKVAARIKLGFNTADFVLSYLGSIGTWYMLDEMLDFFKVLKMQYVGAKFLFVSNGEEETIRSRAHKKGISLNDIKIVNAKRNEVPKLVKASTLSLSFIKPAYSKKSSSPTKLGELRAMGLPVICNTKIGDVDGIVTYTNGGLLISDFNENEYQRAVGNLKQFLETHLPGETRKLSKHYYDLNEGVEKYKKIYQRLLN